MGVRRERRGRDAVEGGEGGAADGGVGADGVAAERRGEGGEGGLRHAPQHAEADRAHARAALHVGDDRGGVRRDRGGVELGEALERVLLDARVEVADVAEEEGGVRSEQRAAQPAGGGGRGEVRGTVRGRGARG